MIRFDVRFCYFAEMGERTRPEDSMADCPLLYWVPTPTDDPDECGDFRPRCCLDDLNITPERQRVPKGCPLREHSWTIRLLGSSR